MRFRRPKKRTVWALAVALVFVISYQQLLWPGLREQIAIRKIEAIGGIVGTEEGGPAWLRNWVGDRWMSTFTRVTRVVLPFGADDDALKTVGTFAQLTDLSLEFAKPTDAGWSHLRGLRNLLNLDLTNAQFGDAALRHLKGLSRLQSLKLSNTDVTDAALPALAEMKSLQSLQLGGTKITGAGRAQLKALSNLRFLKIDGTSSTVGPAGELQNALPDCKIEWTGGFVLPDRSELVRQLEEELRRELDEEE